jgi:hypothetical protein
MMKTNTPTLLAISMALWMRRGNAECIAQWRKFRAFVEATGSCHHGQVSAVYCPGGRRGHIQNNGNKKQAYFASHSDGHGNAPVN